MMTDHVSLLGRFEQLLPLAVTWAAEQEEFIRREGVPLTEAETEDARAVGVGRPEHIRLMRVGVIPRPAQAELLAACDAIDFLSPATRGLALGYGIFVRNDCWRERNLIAHELVHTAQYERLGGLEPFLRQYLKECLTVGYHQSLLEQEAVTKSAALQL